MIFKYGCDELMSDVSISVIVIATCPLLVSLYAFLSVSLCLSLGEDVMNDDVNMPAASIPLY